MMRQSVPQASLLSLHRVKLPPILHTQHSTVSQQMYHSTCVFQRLTDCIQDLGLHCNLSQYAELLRGWSIHLGLDEQRHNSTPFPDQSWFMNYTVLSFLLNGHLYAEYAPLQGMLGLPSCSDKQWRRIVAELEVKVTELAEWSCQQVREAIKGKLH